MNDGEKKSTGPAGNAKTSPAHDAPRPTEGSRSLCAPDPQRSCFGCCPPIRPAHYDPLDWVSSLKREFRENRELFPENRRFGRPVVGFSCWALGYLDPKGVQIGCLLHPARHGGEDLRHLTGYREKCARESCLQAKHFERLSPHAQSFWLGITEGLGSFYYSSRRANPLFHLLLWGPAVLEKLAARGRTQSLHVTELVHHYPFLVHERWNPRGHRFLMETIFDECRKALGWDSQRIEEAAQRLHEAVCREIARVGEGLFRPPLVYVHRMGLSAAFADYLRGIHGIFKANSRGLFHIKDRTLRWVRRGAITGDSPGDPPFS